MFSNLDVPVHSELMHKNVETNKEVSLDSPKLDDGTIVASSENVFPCT